MVRLLRLQVHHQKFHYSVLVKGRSSPAIKAENVPPCEVYGALGRKILHARGILGLRLNMTEGIFCRGHILHTWRSTLAPSQNCRWTMRTTIAISAALVFL